MTISNCLGLSADKLKKELKDISENIVLEELVNKTLFNENKEEKNDCEKLCEDSVLSNFNEFLLNSLKNEFDKINLADKLNLPYDISNLGDSLKKSVLNNMKEFSNLLKHGKTKELSDLVNKNNRNNSIFPNNISNDLKEKILTLLDKSNYFNNKNNPNNAMSKYANDSIVIDSDAIKNLNRSASDNLFGDLTPIKVIDVKDIESINLKKVEYKCFKENFKISDYIINIDKDVIVTADKVAKLKRIHSEILTPIYKYYFKEFDDSQCNLKIYYGLLSLKEANLSASGSFISKHVAGEAVDFQLVGIPNIQILEDIKNKKIDIEFGVLVITNGLHITLPYPINGTFVRNIILSSTNNTTDSLLIDFI